jgi:hypothetical protein
VLTKFDPALKGPAARFLWLVLLPLLVNPVSARQVSFPRNIRRQPPTTQQTQDEEYIKPSRPGVANPAEIHKAGVLQLEYGYDGSFRADDFRAQHTSPLNIRFAASGRLLLELDFDVIDSMTDPSGMRMTGIGDSRLGVQVVAFKHTDTHPALAFAYQVKLPSASEEKGLGTGRFDHRIAALLSDKFGQLDMDLNGAILVVGREGAGGWVTGGQGALSFSGEFENGFGLEGELSGQTKDDAQPKGMYALGAVTYKVNGRLRLDSGMRFGLTPSAPRAGFFAGMTIGIADFYRK